MIPTDAVAKSLGCAVHPLRWLAGDGSDRKFYRVIAEDGTGSWVLMELGAGDAELLQKSEYLWIRLAAFLKQQGIRTPLIRALLPEHAGILMEDCGDATLSTVVAALQGEGCAGKVRQLYHAAFRIAGQLLAAPVRGPQPWYRSSFDAQFFLKELGFCQEHFLKAFLGIRLNGEQGGLFRTECERLARSLGQRPGFLAHRDFHSRNLMVQEGELITIDFQDARPGPAAYDLVSLCFDPYVKLGVDERFDLFWQGVSGLAAGVSGEIKACWKEAALQRLYKILGSYAYLSRVRPAGNWGRYMEPSLEMLRCLRHRDFPFLSEVLPEQIEASLGYRERVRS